MDMAVSNGFRLKRRVPSVKNTTSSNERAENEECDKLQFRLMILGIHSSAEQRM